MLALYHRKRDLGDDAGTQPPPMPVMTAPAPVPTMVATPSAPTDTAPIEGMLGKVLLLAAILGVSIAGGIAVAAAASSSEHEE
jgi:hypothetical protein